MKKVFRFAPSPTGYLHIGNARTALWNALLARKEGGIFILRFDDTDVERSKEEYVVAILEDLSWLGINPDQIFHQSKRIALYEEKFALLKENGLIYAAYETAEELDRKRKRQQARGLPPVYDRSSLLLTKDEKEKYEMEGRKPHWRFKLSGKSVSWEDGIRSSSHIETSSMSDPIIVREDGTFLYTFASVVDDISLNVTDILRGEDHVANSAVQIEIFNALLQLENKDICEKNIPRFSHHNLIASATGEEMSKRKGSLSIRSFREMGADPMAVAVVATLTGTSQSIRPINNLDLLANELSVENISRALTKFSPQEIFDISKKLLHLRSFNEVADKLALMGIDGVNAEPFWNAIVGNLSKIEEAKDWWEILTEPMRFAQNQSDLLSQAAELLPIEPWGDNIYKEWIDALVAKTNQKGKALFLPLRLALTGRENGPDFKSMLPILGRKEVIARLTYAGK